MADQTSPESLELDLGELLTLCPGCGLPCRRTEAGRADCDCHKPPNSIPDWVLEVDAGVLWEQRKSLRAALAAEEEAFSRRMFAQGKR